jgi:hypothetical protein
VRPQTLQSQTSSLIPLINSWVPPLDKRYTINENQSLWFAEVNCKLNKLASLPNNWDGYGAKAVLFENANFALNILSNICDASHQAPTIVPGSSGDLQIEWHTTQGDLELHIIAPYQVHAWYSVLGENPIEEELTLTFDFSKVAPILESILEIPIAAVAAAA